MTAPASCSSPSPCRPSPTGVDRQGIVTFAAAILVSVAIGLAFGGVAARLLLLVDDCDRASDSVVVAYGSYLVADAFHLSGVLATVTAAIVLGNVGPGRVFSAAGTDAIEHGLGVPGLCADRDRVPARRPGHPAGAGCSASSARSPG